MLVEDVFVTEGVPTITFIEPPNYNEILIDIRKNGKPVIIEGQSGTGKTTCAKKILDSLEKRLVITYLSARKPDDIIEIEKIDFADTDKYYIIDDFHRLNKDLQEKLANMAKIIAEEGIKNAPKLIFIGINEVGQSLIKVVPDIAKRIGIHNIMPGNKESILSLIETGSKQLNINILDRDKDKIFLESRGDYWLTQQLCQSLCSLNNILETENSLKTLTLELDALRKKVINKTYSAYYEIVKEFCRGRRFRPSNDPYYRLLKAIGEQDSSSVDLNELANAKEDIRGSINGIKEGRLSVLLQDKPSCSKNFYYDQETKTFAIEDPALFYFIKHLDWVQLRKDCGFRDDVRGYEFDFAISFAGENRILAEEITRQLEMFDMNVFYDKNHEDNMLGKNWGLVFEKIYSEKSRFVVCLLDCNYREKMWPSFERSCVKTRVQDGDVIPIYLDKMRFVEIPESTVGIFFELDGGKKLEDNVFDSITERLDNKLKSV